MRRRAFDLQLRRRDALQSDVDAEIAFHLELRIAQLMEQGLTRDQATQAAYRQFGPVDEARGQLGSLATTRDTHMRLTEQLGSWRQDLGYTLRQFRRAPAFAAAVILTLGLGIGANATMFGAIDQLLLRPPAHVVDPGRVVTMAIRHAAGLGLPPQQVLSFAIYRDLRGATNAFQIVGLSRTDPVDYGEGERTRSVSGNLVTADYFRALGTRPALGRFFSESEAGDQPAEPVAVLGFEFWQRELLGDSGAIGQTIALAGRPHRIIGVAPEGFHGLGLTPVDVYIPITDGMSAATIASLATQRQNYAYTIVARLRPDVTIGAAENAATATLLNGDRAAGTSEQELTARAPRVELTSALPRDARGSQPDARIALLLGLVSAFVLVLACANVVNLQLARAVRRRREIAVRIALGVGRARLIRQLGLDCLVLAAAGGILGLLIARVGGAYLRGVLLGSALVPIAATDGRVLLFSAVVTLGAGLVTGLLPTVDVLRSDLVSSLKEGARGSGSHQTRRLHFALLVAQAALATVLLVGTGLFVLSLRRIEAVPLGFTPDRVAVARPNFSGRRSAELPVDDTIRRAEIVTLFERLQETARRTPGVSAAALALTAPFEGSYSMEVTLPGRDSLPMTRDGGPYYNAVTPEYFNVIGTRLVIGRAFAATDQSNGPRVVIVNQTAARLWWPGESALGKCVHVGDPDSPCAEVVGVAQNTHRRQIIEDDFVQVFVPLTQARSLAPGVVLFGTTGDQDRVIAQAQRRMQSALPGLPYINVRPLDALVAPRLRAWRLGATMFSVFGALAVLLAGIGIYSVLAYDVAERRMELGVRSALGAATRQLALSVVGRGVRAVATGALFGTAIALIAGPRIVNLLFQTSPRDPVVLAGVWAVLATVAIAATLLPAIRASRIDPIEALRGST